MSGKPPGRLGALCQQLLETVRQESPTEGEPPLLRSFDWHEHGIKQPYLIFMTGRCGSTWLTNLLRKTRLVGNPDEFLNADVARYKIKPGQSGLQEYFSGVVRTESMHGRFGLQVDPLRLVQSQAIIDWPAVFPTAGTQCFYLYRQDLLAQAWSWVVAQRSGYWHANGQFTDVAQNRSLDYVPTERQLAEEMVRIRATEEQLDAFFVRFGYKPQYIPYESLLSELSTQLSLIFLKLGLDEEIGPVIEGLQSASPGIDKLKYNQKQRILAEFSITHAAVMNDLHVARFRSSSAQLREQLAPAWLTEAAVNA